MDHEILSNSHRVLTCGRYVRSKYGFTLIELLVVVAIITVLVAILLPTMKKARGIAINLRCAANLHQIGIWGYMYVTDNRRILPSNGYTINGYRTISTTSWAQKTPYWKNTTSGNSILFCPGVSRAIDPNAYTGIAGTFHYQLNAWMGATSTGVWGLPPAQKLRSNLLTAEKYWIGDGPVQNWGSDAHPLWACNGYSDLFNIGSSWMTSWSWSGSIRRNRHENKIANLLFGDGHVLARTWEEQLSLTSAERRRMTGYGGYGEY